MKILLFGSSGMIGTSMEKICHEENIEFIGLNHQDIDVTDENAVRMSIEQHNPTVVFNSVVIIGPPCEADPIKAYNVNTIAAYYMAKICEEKSIIFIQPSTHAIFDGIKDEYYTEADEPKPMNIYSSSKYAAEQLVMNLCSKYYVVRFPTMFGPRRNSALGFVDKVIKRINNGENLRIVDDKIDSMTYAIDVAMQIIEMLKQKMDYGVYHLANKGKVNYYEFVKKLMELLSVKNELVRAKASDFPNTGHQALKTAMKSDKLSPMRPWEDALSDYVSNYLITKEITV